MRTHTDRAAVETLLDFLDNEVDAIIHALTTMAQDNEKAAEYANATPGASGYAVAFEESARSWRHKAERLVALFEAAAPQEGEEA